MNRPYPVRLWEAGYRALVSVIPPNAQLSPNSKVLPQNRGKTPGRKNANGTWSGWSGWQDYSMTLEDAKQWAQDGANIGILGAYYPGVDIDILDPWLAEMVQGITIAALGWAPSRTGRPPKRLLMYRTGTPFVRFVAYIEYEGVTHKVEILCDGRQYLIRGQHPDGMMYQWDRDLLEIDPGEDLTWIDEAKIEAYLATLKEHLEAIPGMTVTVKRDGSGAERASIAQDGLLAPSVDALREAVAMIPNDDELFPSREDYVKMGYAIRAAAGEKEVDGFEIFAEWAGRHERDGRIEGNPETWRSDWDRMHGPYSIGWSWLSEIARQCGFNSARFEFEADLDLAVMEERHAEAPEFSDVWLAERVIEEYGSSIRYVPATGMWYVWSSGRWEPDAVLLADHLIGLALQRQATLIARQGATDRERARNATIAKSLCSASKHRDVRMVMRSDPRVTATPSAFDSDPWVLNTPGGIVDLLTGDLKAHDPDALCSLQTLVTPDFDMEIPEWKRFLLEACGGDLDLLLYMQRFAGYALTGSVEEQVLAFLYGTGTNGKGTYLNTLMAIMRDYAEQAAMDTFIASRSDRHPTDLAGLVGKRLVLASETQAGRAWDEARVKTLTGNDQIRARFMRQDFFTYTPQFKLAFMGNHRPTIRDLDPAMRRRIHLIPFVHKPKVIDLGLREKLIPEYPGILAWAIVGCVRWQNEGLAPPAPVLEATREYFAEEDPIAQWVDESCEVHPELEDTLMNLFRSWTEWANERGEFPGSVKRFAQLLATKDFLIGRSPQRTRVVSGVRAIPATELAIP